MLFRPLGVDGLITSVLTVLTVACAQGTRTQPATGVVSGTISYRERIALPPDAVAEVWIADVSPMMVAQVILGQTTVSARGRQVPLPFELRYDPARAEASHTYSLKAVIKSSDGQTLFTSSETPTLVITQGNPSRVDLVLVRERQGGGTSGLSGTSWLLEDLAGAGVVDRVQATLEFPESGRAVGNASCNRFFGSVEITGTAIKFGSLGSTRMACAEAVNNQEMKYLKALENAARLTIDGTTLRIFVKGEEKPLRFTRRG